MKIRIAAAEDIPEIEELYRQLFAAMAEIQPGIYPSGFSGGIIYTNEYRKRRSRYPYRLGGRENGWLSYGPAKVRAAL